MKFRNRISVVLSIFFLFLGALNAVTCIIEGRGAGAFVTHVGLLLVFSIAFFLLARSSAAMAPRLQSLAIMAIGVIQYAMNDPNNASGLFVLGLGVADGYDSGLFSRLSKVKLGSVGLVVAIVAAIAAMKAGSSLTAPLCSVALFIAYVAIVYLKFYQHRLEPMAKLADMGLTPHEIEYAKLLGRDLSYKEIAREMGTTEATVRVTFSKIFRKCGVKSRTGLAVLMHEMNVI